MVHGTLFGKATRVVGQKASVHLTVRCTSTMLNVALLKSFGRDWSSEVLSLFLEVMGACAGCPDGPLVPRNGRCVPGKVTVTVFTVYGRLSHFGKAVTVWRGVW